MPGNIDEQAQRRRRKEAWYSAAVSTAWLLVSAAVLLYLRHRFVPEGIWSVVMALLITLELGMIIPVWILLKTRLKEIEGGEEDEASKY